MRLLGIILGLSGWGMIASLQEPDGSQQPCVVLEWMRADTIRVAECINSTTLDTKYADSLPISQTGPDLCRTIASQATPLHYAAARNSGDVVELILEKAEDSDRLMRATDKEGRVPLHYAVCNNSADVVRKLLDGDRSSLRELKDKQGRTPLHYAVYRYNNHWNSVLAETPTEAARDIIEMVAKGTQGIWEVRDERGKTAWDEWTADESIKWTARDSTGAQKLWARAKGVMDETRNPLEFVAVVVGLAALVIDAIWKRLIWRLLYSGIARLTGKTRKDESSSTAKHNS